MSKTVTRVIPRETVPLLLNFYARTLALSMTLSFFSLEVLHALEHFYCLSLCTSATRAVLAKAGDSYMDCAHICYALPLGHLLPLRTLRNERGDWGYTWLSTPGGVA